MSDARERSHGVRFVHAAVLVGALQSAVRNLEGRGQTWEEMIASAERRGEYVDVSEMDAEAEVCDIDTSVCPEETEDIAASTANFLTDTVMFQNGYECVLGLDTYNGTPGYVGFNTWKAAGGTKLLKIDLKVSHVGGGILKIHGLWKDALLHNHSHPMTFDMVVGSYSVSTAEILMGITSMGKLNGVLMIRSGLAAFEDDDGETFLFGKGKSTAVDPGKLKKLLAKEGAKLNAISNRLENRAAAGSIKSALSKPKSTQATTYDRCFLASSLQCSLEQAYLDASVKAGFLVTMIDSLMLELEEMDADGIFCWKKVKIPDQLWTGMSKDLPRAMPVWRDSLFKTVFDRLSDDSCKGRLRSAKMEADILIDLYTRQLFLQHRFLTHVKATIRGGFGSRTPSKTFCGALKIEVAASEFEILADGELRPAPADPESPEGEALRSYIKWKGLAQDVHRTYERGHGPDEPVPMDNSSFYSKNEFQTFVRESLNQGSRGQFATVRPNIEKWYGMRNIPWLQLAAEWKKGGPSGGAARKRFSDAYEGSDLSGFDDVKKSAPRVKFDDDDGRVLEAKSVKIEPDSCPDDFERDAELLDQADKPTATDIETLLGGLEAEYNAENEHQVVAPIDCACLKTGLSAVSAENCSIDDASESDITDFLASIPGEQRVEIPMELLVDGVSAELFSTSEPLSIGAIDVGNGYAIAMKVHDVRAVRRSLDRLHTATLCAVGENQRKSLTQEEVKALHRKHYDDIFNQLPHLTRENVEKSDKSLVPKVFETYKRVAAEEGVNKRKFIINDTKWDEDNAVEIKLNEGVTRLPKVDYRRQPPHLLHAAVRMLKVLLECRFYDRGVCGWSMPAILIAKPGADRKTGIGEFRIVGDSTVSNSLTQDISFPVADVGDTMAKINDIAVEVYRQHRESKAGSQRSIDEDRYDPRNRDLKAPPSALTSAWDLVKGFHRMKLKEGLSRDVCSLNYRGLGVLRALRCSQGPKQIPASWSRFISALVNRSAMLHEPGINEPVDPQDEKDLKEFLGRHTGDYTSTPPHSFMQIYVDDCVTVAVDEEQCLRQALTIVFWFRRLQLFLNPEKSKVGCESVSFLGFCAGFNIQFANPERCKAIALIPEPTTVKEMRRYIGGTGYYSNCVEGYAELAAPLHRCTRNDVPAGDITGHWFITLPPEDPDHLTHWKVKKTGEKVLKSKSFTVSTQDGFEIIKTRLCVGALLRSPDWSKRFYIMCDAAQTGYGAVLSQMGDEARLCPLHFHSCHFNDQEQRRPSVVREAYAATASVWTFRWAVCGTRFNFLLIGDCRALEQARKARKINNHFIARLALKLDEFPGMDMFWREGHSGALMCPDLLSRALIEYDGSKTPDQQGYDGPFTYRDCPNWNVLNGIWEPEVLLASLEARACASELDLDDFGREFDDDGTELFCLETQRTLVEPDWIRYDAYDLLQLEGDYKSVTGDGLTVVNDPQVELAVLQPQITRDYLLTVACMHRPEIEHLIGLKFSRGGDQPNIKSSAAFAMIGYSSDLPGLTTDVGAIYHDYFRNKESTTIAGTQSRSQKSKKGASKGTKKGKKSLHKPAEGERRGDEWISADNDTFNRIATTLGWESTKKLVEFNPQINLDKSAKGNSRLKAGTVVYLSAKKAIEKLKRLTPDSADPKDGGMSMTKIDYETSPSIKPLFEPKDYLKADDEKVTEIYRVLKGDLQKPKHLDVSNYQISSTGYLLKLDQPTNKMATVVPTKEAQEELVRRFHHDFESHPHHRRQVYMMRQLVTWRTLNKDVKEFEKKCECNAWKTRTHYHYGPMELFTRPVEPNVVWHVDFLTGLVPTNDGGAARLLNCILTVVDEFSGMCWLLPTSDTLSARECGELILRRIMLEDSRGICVTMVSDRDQRFVGEAFRHIMTLAGCRETQTMSHHSTANGKVERIHRIIWRLLEGLGLDQHKWIDRLPYATYFLRTQAGGSGKSDPRAGYSPVEIESGLTPRPPVATSQGLLRVRHATERDTQEHLQELMSIRDEVYEAGRLADEYRKSHYDKKTSKWKDEELLQPGSKVWLEVRDRPLVTDHLTPTRKMRTRKIGPVTIKRRRRHFTFEVDMGKSKHHDVYHMSRLSPFYGNRSEGTPVEDEPDPVSSDPHAGTRPDGRRYEVEKILGHRGKPGTGHHRYLVKWKGYIPQKSSWQKASDVKAPKAIAAYEANLKLQRAYLDGEIDTLANNNDDDSARLDPDSFTETDALVCGLMCEMPDRMLHFACQRWTERELYFED